jgi:RNA polymerase sigma-70 factor, ECF subfamily
MAAGTLRGRVFASASHAKDSADALDLPEVYDMYADYIVRCLRSLGVRADLVDDAFQDVFLVVQNKLPSFEGRSTLRTWLYAIVLRVARRYRERAATEAIRFVDADPPSHARVEEGLEHNEQLVLARRALAALDDGKREVFVLAMIEQMSAPEIAAAMHVPVNTVYSRLRSARAEFTEQVARLRRTKPRRHP